MDAIATGTDVTTMHAPDPIHITTTGMLMTVYYGAAVDDGMKDHLLLHLFLPHSPCLTQRD